MKKSELRNLIKEMLNEELDKKDSLVEAVVDAPKTMSAVSASVRSGSVEEIAYDILESEEFANAFEADGEDVYGDNVWDLVEREVAIKYPTADASRRSVICGKVLHHIAANVEATAPLGASKPLDDPDVQRVIRDHGFAGNNY
jgi:hypothetical protein